jgi:hypothetical protein
MCWECCLLFVVCVYLRSLSSPPQDFLQVLSMFAGFDFDWPGPVMAIYNAFSLVNFNFELLAPECSVSINFETKWCAVCLPAAPVCEVLSAAPAGSNSGLGHSHVFMFLWTAFLLVGTGFTTCACCVLCYVNAWACIAGVCACAGTSSRACLLCSCSPSWR